jgi:hypothetical protein
MKSDCFLKKKEKKRVRSEATASPQQSGEEQWPAGGGRHRQRRLPRRRPPPLRVIYLRGSPSEGKQGSLHAGRPSGSNPSRLSFTLPQSLVCSHACVLARFSSCKLHQVVDDLMVVWFDCLQGLGAMPCRFYHLFLQPIWLMNVLPESFIFHHRPVCHAEYARWMSS